MEPAAAAPGSHPSSILFDPSKRGTAISSTPLDSPQGSQALQVTAATSCDCSLPYQHVCMPLWLKRSLLLAGVHRNEMLCSFPAPLFLTPCPHTLGLPCSYARAW